MNTLVEPEGMLLGTDLPVLSQDMWVKSEHYPKLLGRRRQFIIRYPHAGCGY